MVGWSSSRGGMRFTGRSKIRSAVTAETAVTLLRELFLEVGKWRLVFRSAQGLEEDFVLLKVKLALIGFEGCDALRFGKKELIVSVSGSPLRGRASGGKAMMGLERN